MSHPSNETIDLDQPGLWLDADPEQLVQAFLNLGINSCEAMHYEGVLRLRVGAEGGACEIHVGDNGPGLDPERVEDIFTPFVTTKQQGTAVLAPQEITEDSVVVALGGIAHRAILRALELRQADYKFAHAADHELGDIRMLDSYHCSRYNTQTRRLTTPMFEAVFARARALLD